MLPVTFLLHFVPTPKQLGIGADKETAKAASELAHKTHSKQADQAACFHNRFPEMHFLYWDRA